MCIDLKFHENKSRNEEAMVILVSVHPYDVTPGTFENPHADIFLPLSLSYLSHTVKHQILRSIL